MRTPIVPATLNQLPTKRPGVQPSIPLLDMFFRSTTLIAATAAILFAHTSLSAAVYRARSDHVQALDAEQELEARTEYTTNLANSTQLLVARKGAGGAADLLGDVVTSIITGIQDGINADKDVGIMITKREIFFLTYWLFTVGAGQVHF